MQRMMASLAESSREMRTRFEKSRMNQRETIKECAHELAETKSETLIRHRVSNVIMGSLDVLEEADDYSEAQDEHCPIIKRFAKDIRRHQDAIRCESPPDVRDESHLERKRCILKMNEEMRALHDLVYRMRIIVAKAATTEPKRETLVSTFSATEFVLTPKGEIINFSFFDELLVVLQFAIDVAVEETELYWKQMRG